MMEFSVPMANVSITSPVTKLPLVFINPAAAPKPNLEFVRAWWSQSSTATSQQLAIAIQTLATAFPTLTSQAPVALKPAGPASTITGGTAGAAGTAGVNASAAGTGTLVTVYPDDCNNLNGWLWVATPREIITMPAGSATGIGLFLLTAPSNLANQSAGMIFSEV